MDIQFTKNKEKYNLLVNQHYIIISFYYLLHIL